MILLNIQNRIYNWFIYVKLWISYVCNLKLEIFLLSCFDIKFPHIHMLNWKPIYISVKNILKWIIMIAKIISFLVSISIVKVFRPLHSTRSQSCIEVNLVYSPSQGKYVFYLLYLDTDNNLLHNVLITHKNIIIQLTQDQTWINFPQSWYEQKQNLWNQLFSLSKITYKKIHLHQGQTCSRITQWTLRNPQIWTYSRQIGYHSLKIWIPGADLLTSQTT